MNCLEDVALQKERVIVSLWSNNSESESSREGGYVSYDELDDDCDKLNRSASASPTSLSSNDAGYTSSVDEDIITSDSVRYGKLPRPEIVRNETRVEVFTPDSLSCLDEGLKEGLPQDLDVPINDPPDWLDIDKFRAGQKFAVDYWVGLNFSQLISLLLLFSFPDGVQPLVFTDKSSTPFTAYKRYLSTALKVKSWYEHDVWTEGTQGFHNLRAVRAMHLNVSNKMNSCPAAELKKKVTLEGSEKYPSLWCPMHSKLKEYFESACPATASSKIVAEKYSSRNSGRIFLSQGEMSMTQFGFFGLMIMYPDKFGAASATREELENFVHCWRGIAYLLGVKDEYNFCQGSFDEVRQRCFDVVNHLVKPNFPHLSKDWEHMARCAVQGVNSYFPLVNFEACFAYLCWVVGIDAPVFYTSLTWWQYFLFSNIKFVMRFILRIPGVLPFLNKRVNRILQKETSVSVERLEYLKNKVYSYQKEDNLITRL